MTVTAVSTNHITICPNCGCSHGTETNIILIVEERMRNDEFEDMRREMEQARYEAIGRTRELAKSAIPMLFPELPRRAGKSVLLHHLQRCPNRRHRMSIRQRVKQYMRFRKTPRNRG